MATTNPANSPPIHWIAYLYSQDPKTNAFFAKLDALEEAGSCGSFRALLNPTYTPGSDANLSLPDCKLILLFCQKFAPNKTNRGEFDEVEATTIGRVLFDVGYRRVRNAWRRAKELNTPPVALLGDAELHPDLAGGEGVGGGGGGAATDTVLDAFLDSLLEDDDLSAALARVVELGGAEIEIPVPTPNGSLTSAPLQQQQPAVARAPEGSSAPSAGVLVKTNTVAQLGALDQLQPSSQQHQLQPSSQQQRTKIQDLCKHVFELKLADTPESKQDFENTMQEIWSLFNDWNHNEDTHLPPQERQRHQKVHNLIMNVDDLWSTVEGGDTSAEIQLRLASAKSELLHFLGQWRHNENSGRMPAGFNVMRRFGVSHELFEHQQQQTHSRELAGILDLYDEVNELVLSGLHGQHDHSWMPTERRAHSQTQQLSSMMKAYEEAMLGQELPIEYVRMKRAFQALDNVQRDRQKDKTTIMKLTSKLNNRGG